MSLRAQIELITSPQDFVVLCNSVLIAEYGDDFLPIDDDRADRGNDGYVKSERRLFAAHCFKRIQNQRIDTLIERKMIGDLKKAIALRGSGSWPIDAWTFLSNYPISEALAAGAVELGSQEDIDVSWRGPAYFALALERHPAAASAVPVLRLSMISGLAVRIEGALATEAATGMGEAARIPETEAEAAALVRDQPSGWEYLLFAGTLARGRRQLERKLADNDLELPSRPWVRLDGAEVHNRLSTAFGQLGTIIDPMTRVFAAQEAAFGAPGESGDPIRIEQFANWVVHACEDMLDWAADLRALVVPAEFEDAVKLTARSAELPISQIVGFIDECVTEMGRIPDHLAKTAAEQAKEPLVIETQLVLDADTDTMDQALDALRAALEP